MEDSDDGMLSMSDGEGEEGEEGGADLEEGDDEEYILSLEPEVGGGGGKVKGDDEFPCEVVTAEKVVQQMTEIIRDVNLVIQVLSRLASDWSNSLGIHQVQRRKLSWSFLGFRFGLFRFDLTPFYAVKLDEHHSL